MTQVKTIKSQRKFALRDVSCKNEIQLTELNEEHRKIIHRTRVEVFLNKELD